MATKTHKQQKISNRVNRISGQINGINNMLESGRSCDEVITQIQAAKAGLSSLAAELVRLEAEECIGCSDDPQKQSDQIVKLANNIFKIT